MNHPVLTAKTCNETKHNCLLSIIVPVYNVEAYIHACLDSIFKQDIDETLFEVIIVNDGTEDRSMEMIADIISQHNNITVINQENLSLSVARNNGIAAAKGEYILMPDSDDLLIENSLSVLLEKAISSKVDMVVADFVEMTDVEISNIKNIPQKELQIKEKTGKELFLEDLNPRQCYVWRTLFRKEFLQKEQITFIPGICYQDVPFTHECCLKANKCLKVSWLLNIYRRGQESATSSFNKRKAKDLCIAIARTWELKQIVNLSDDVQKKLNDNIFASFSLLIYWMLYYIKSYSDRKEIFDFLRYKVPDLFFTNGAKQIVTSVMFKYSPHFYFAIRKVLKRDTFKSSY